MKKRLALLAAAVMLSGGLWCVASKGMEVWPQEESGTGQLGVKAETVEGAGGTNEPESERAGEEESEPAEESAAGESDIENLPEEKEPAAEFAAEPVVARPKVRGIYVTGPMAGTGNMDNLIALVERSELNAMVIDIKNDEGYITCEMDVPLAQEVGSVKRYVKDMPALVQKCKEKGIYLIARIVTFKDPYLAEAVPEWSLHNADGTIFRDRSGLAWVNPYEVQVWDYLVQVALGAVELGFDEVQFDYIRFSTDRGMKQVDFGPTAQGKEKTQVITEFAAYAAERIRQAGAAVSADVYGVVIDSATDQQIVGQDYVALAQYLDYLSPMVYPSHYGPYNYNIPVPDAQPYDTVLAAMQASKKVLAGVLPVTGTDASKDSTAADSVSGNSAPADGGSDNLAAGSGASENQTAGDSVLGSAFPEWSAEQIAALPAMETIRADVRPWLQDFTASWVKGHIKYGPQQIRDQIQAVYDAGYEEWILWNAANRYTEGGLYPAGGQGGM